MYGICIYIYSKNCTNVGKYSIHGASGSGKHTKNYGKSPSFIGKSTINGPISVGSQPVDFKEKVVCLKTLCTPLYTLLCFSINFSLRHGYDWRHTTISRHTNFYKWLPVWAHKNFDLSAQQLRFPWMLLVESLEYHLNIFYRGRLLTNIRIGYSPNPCWESLLTSLNIYWHRLTSVDIYWHRVTSITIYWHLLTNQLLPCCFRLGVLSFVRSGLKRSSLRSWAKKQWSCAENHWVLECLQCGAPVW